MNKKIFSLVTAAVLTCAAAFPFAACRKKNVDGGLDEDGNFRPGSGVTTVTFWGYGDDSEKAVFEQLKDEFNEEYEGQIKVNYIQKSSDGYSEAVRLALQQTHGPDVVYAGDSEYKALAELGFLEPLDSYLEKSQTVDLSEMWDSAVTRFKYDVDTTTVDGPNAKQWGLPKDVGPTVIYYNETYFKNAGIKTISVAAEDLDKFNEGNFADDRGQTKDALGISGTVPEKGYFQDSAGNWWFNNQIAMSWEETVACAKKVQESERALQKKDNIYGYFTEWWFNYGWSVGGDCIEYVETDDPAYNGGYWDFTLMENTPNYIVADDQTNGFDVGDSHYNAGEIISWEDKLVDTQATTKTIKSEIIQAAESGVLNELPSQREAFVEFVRLSSSSNTIVDKIDGQELKGYGVTPSPTSIGGDAGKTLAFKNGQVAMLVDGRWNVTNFREQMTDYEWDVAPLPMYKEYEGDEVSVHGVEAGHSGSVALVLNAKSTVKNAAWKFIEFVAGERGQLLQAEAGFAIPLQKELAYSDEFLAPGQDPKNAEIFIRAAEVETPGDWWYLYDKAWIDDWAGVLNGDVRDGKKTLTEFEQSAEYLGTWEKLKEYTRKD